MEAPSHAGCWEHGQESQCCCPPCPYSCSGLRQWMAGFLCSNKIAALFMKVGKRFPPAEELSCKVQDLEQLIESM